MDRDDLTAVLLAGLGAAGFLLYSQRKTVMVYGSKALDLANRSIFKAALPDHADPYSDLILTVAREESVDPFILFALGERESRWGEALDSNKTGDKAKRDPEKWGYALPPDGFGWGRGIMQIDYPRAVRENHNWRDAYSNVKLGARVFKEKLAEVQAKPSGSWNIDSSLAVKLGVKPGLYPAKAIPSEYAVRAALAAYNAGAGAVRRAYSAGGLAAIDRATTGSDYSGSVWATMANAASDFARRIGV